MFSSNECLIKGCSRLSVSYSDHCFEHLENPDEYTDKIIQYINTNEKIINLNISGICLKNIEIKGKKFFSCKFSESIFENVKFDDCYIRQSFFDMSEFNKCIFTDTNIKFASFAGSKFNECRIEMSDFLHTNFNGIKSYKTVFAESDLYFSSFIKADFRETLYDDCNLRKVKYFFADISGIKFKNSNHEDAYYDRKDRIALDKI